MKHPSKAIVGGVRLKWFLLARCGHLLWVPAIHVVAVAARSVTSVTAVSSFDLLQDLTEVVALRRLQRRELFVCLQMLSPQLLPNGQHVPIVQEGRYWATQRTTEPQRRLLRVEGANRLLERVALDVLHQGEVERDERQDPAGRPGLRHSVVHLPVLVADRGRRRSGEIEEVVARRLGRVAFEVVALVEPVEGGLDDTGILAGLDLLL